MTDISELVKSEISDFCAGLESPGCPETPEEIQRQLTDRILPLIKDGRREWMARSFSEGYDSGHSRGLTCGRLYKSDDGMRPHKHACLKDHISNSTGDVDL